MAVATTVATRADATNLWSQSKNPFSSGDIIANILQILVEKFGEEANNLTPLIKRLVGNAVHLQYIPFDKVHFSGTYNEEGSKLPKLHFGWSVTTGSDIWATCVPVLRTEGAFEIRYSDEYHDMREIDLKKALPSDAFAGIATARKRNALATCYFMMKGIKPQHLNPLTDALINTIPEICTIFKYKGDEAPVVKMSNEEALSDPFFRGGTQTRSATENDSFIERSNGDFQLSNHLAVLATQDQNLEIERDDLDLLAYYQTFRGSQICGSSPSSAIFTANGDLRLLDNYECESMTQQTSNNGNYMSDEFSDLPMTSQDPGFTIYEDMETESAPMEHNGHGKLVQVSKEDKSGMPGLLGDPLFDSGFFSSDV
ncbi:hypothetical protein B0J11DRAFT_510139 [Dendryphion nanum]|uniref:Uncharacterized protein n=1 Tax=Dendryphion nanum TaxID=256645 RepID=A0A9P9IDV2_9PLEO|nr:hypothetical protein B0J11DRAFT_510139 [Dendryphion nanum]